MHPSPWRYHSYRHYVLLNRARLWYVRLRTRVLIRPSRSVIRRGESLEREALLSRVLIQRMINKTDYSLSTQDIRYREHFDRAGCKHFRIYFDMKSYFSSWRWIPREMTLRFAINQTVASNRIWQRSFKQDTPGRSWMQTVWFDVKFLNIIRSGDEFRQSSVIDLAKRLFAKATDSKKKERTSISRAKWNKKLMDDEKAPRSIGAGYSMAEFFSPLESSVFPLQFLRLL